MSLAAFLDWERGQEIAHEFDGVAPVAMTSCTLAHRAIADTLTRLLNDALLPRGCQAFAGDVKVVVAGRVRYPDVAVTCVRVNLSDDILPEPVLVVEILSPSTARTDRVLKLEEYRLTPSIRHYLLLEQETADGVLFTRDGETWRAEVVSAPGDIVLAALDVRIPVAEAYRRVIASG
jgi:Uma2 family endonuclease